MTIKIFLTSVSGLLYTVFAFAQDSIVPLKLSGSVDVYYKYDLAGIENEAGMGNISTSFAGNQNSVSIGMANLILSQSREKVGFVADIAFGPRGQGQSILNSEDGNSFHIQNLNVSYTTLADRFTFTAGFMSTFMGYEVISPVDNFQYSTSYLFTNGAFQNSGVKASYSISDKVILMVGLFNDWNEYQDRNGMTDIGAQLAWVPAEGYNLYFNFLHGAQSGMSLEFVSSISFTPVWMTGINFTHQQNAKVVPDYTGLALYQEWGISETFILGLRGEWFKYLNQDSASGQATGPRYFSGTLSGNIHLGPLTLIPEWRIDLSDEEVFINRAGETATSASQILLAAVYAF